jgi:hypothetical protein
LLSIAYSTILVIYYTRTVTLKITSFPIIIIYRIRAVSFKITSFTAAVIKLRSFLKRVISAYIAGRPIEIVF